MKIQYFPMTIVDEVNDLGHKSHAIRYADGRIIHRGYYYREDAEKMIEFLQNRGS